MHVRPAESSSEVRRGTFRSTVLLGGVVAREGASSIVVTSIRESLPGGVSVDCPVLMDR